jgi:CRP-like cAMP-binding protein
VKTLYQPLLRKLDAFVSLDEFERAAIADLPLDVRHALPGDNLVLQGEKPEGIVIVLSGFAIRYKLLPGGRRQIVGFCLPGDLCDIRLDLVRRMDHHVAALTPVVAGVVPTVTMQALMKAHPRVAQALWWSSFVEESIAREWIVNVGYRSALERLSHLFCELYLRLETIGLAGNLSCDLPIRQSEMADTLALSAVHVNRTLMELRRGGLLSFSTRRLVIHDMPGLQAAAGFDPAYLHLAGVASGADTSLA